MSVEYRPAPSRIQFDFEGRRLSFAERCSVPPCGGVDFGVARLNLDLPDQAFDLVLCQQGAAVLCGPPGGAAGDLACTNAPGEGPLSVNSRAPIRSAQV